MRALVHFFFFHERKIDFFFAYEELLLCFRLFSSLELLSFFPSFTCFQMFVLFTSSVILIGFDGMINDNFAFEISKSPGYGGGWSCCWKLQIFTVVNRLKKYLTFFLNYKWTIKRYFSRIKLFFSMFINNALFFFFPYRHRKKLLRFRIRNCNT